MRFSMKKMVLAALGAATLVGALATAPLAFAQPAADAPRMSQREHRLPGERIDARLAYAKAALKITPAQEAQWNALADVLRQQAKPRDPSLSAIDRLQRRQEMMSAASTRANEVLEAAKPLYAVLSDDQKKEADALLSRGDHRGGDRSEHRDRRHGHGSRWH
jgi:hypothetical protein